MSYYYVEPEVAGGWGKNTVFDRTPGKPTFVHKLHYQFDGWLGDELLESTPCFIVSERMAQQIRTARLIGASFDDVEVTTSDQFKDLHPNRQLPKFVWLRVEGRPGRDDFATAPDGRLVVSERALEVLKGHGVANALVTPFQN